MFRKYARTIVFVFVTCNIPDIVCPGQRKGKSLGQSVLGEFFGQIWVSFMFIYALSDYVKGRGNF